MRPGLAVTQQMCARDKGMERCASAQQRTVASQPVGVPRRWSTRPTVAVAGHLFGIPRHRRRWAHNFPDASVTATIEPERPAERYGRSPRAEGRLEVELDAAPVGSTGKRW